MTRTAVPDLDEPELAARYGRRPGLTRRRRWLLVVVAAFLAAVLIGWLLWAALSAPAANVEVDTTAYTIHGTRAVDVSFQVSTDPGTRLACAVQAQSADHTIVGWRIVEIPASNQQVRTLTDRVLTTNQSVTGLISNCWTF